MNVLPAGKPSASVREKFLERNYHYLTRCIRPQDFFTWLRTNNVFSKADEEEVENKYITTYLKAGHLIDIILTKGEKGFTAFMQVIEYTYPELYENLTGKVPGPPPDKFLPPQTCPSRFQSRKGGSTRNTIDMYKAMSALTDKLLRTVIDDQLQVHDLQEFIKGLKKQLTDEAAENMMLSDALEFERDRNEQLSADADETKAKLKEEKEKIASLQRIVDELRASKEQLLAEQMELRRKYDSMGSQVHSLKGEVMLERQKSVALRPQPETIEVLRKKNKELQDQLDQLKLQKVKGGSGETDNYAANELSTLRTKLTENEKKMEHLAGECEVMKDKLRTAEEQSLMLRQSNDKWASTIDQLKQEKDELAARCQDLERNCSEMRQRNEKVELECREFQDRFRDIEATNRKLRQEIELERLRNVESSPRPRSKPVGEEDKPVHKRLSPKAARPGIPVAMMLDVFKNFDYVAAADPPKSPNDSQTPKSPDAHRTVEATGL